MSSKMKISKKQIEKLVEDIWPASQFDHQEVEITLDNKQKHVFIRVTRMYNYVPLSFSIMKQISEKLGCREINDEREHSSGCETCDYGSRYSICLDCWDFEENA